MKLHSPNSLLLAAAVMASLSAAPVLAQTGNSANNAQVQTGTTAGGTANTSTASGDQTLYATGQPLDTKSHEGFWGRMNPMARKKWVNRQVNPVKERLNELDELTASNAKQIKDVDARAQAGIAKAKDEAEVADQHAIAAGNTADQAQQTAQRADTQTADISNTVSNLDQYQTVTRVEIRFRPGHTMLGDNAKNALDQLVGQLQGQRGYLLDVQGYSSLRGQAGVVTSHRLATAVTRYLVTQHQVPLYKIHEIGLGNAPIAESDTSAHRHGSIVEVTLLHNSLSTFSASNSGAPNGAAPQPNNNE